MQFHSDLAYVWRCIVMTIDGNTKSGIAAQKTEVLLSFAQPVYQPIMIVQGRVVADTSWAALLASMADDRIPFPKAVLVRTPCEHGRWLHPQRRVGADTLWEALLVSMADDRIPMVMLVRTPCEHGWWPHPQGHVCADTLWAWPMTASPTPCWCWHLTWQHSLWAC